MPHLPPRKAWGHPPPEAQGLGPAHLVPAAAGAGRYRRASSWPSKLHFGVRSPLSSTGSGSLLPAPGGPASEYQHPPRPPPGCGSWRSMVLESLARAQALLTQRRCRVPLILRSPGSGEPPARSAGFASPLRHTATASAAPRQGFVGSDKCRPRQSSRTMRPTSLPA
ncbi:hypothetical protein NDU88_001644 [Pleurodeles waltl]|uniref:Uncharacterized protein n=1 Tax=Pleurodeles waltl TaxID=8319 RepID=A0AAV7RDF4_PLEWA|nr:hypothetical protein NDU88_001644 [Pleurodeles waltl]